MTTEEVLFDIAAHSADAIQRAAYKFCDRFSMELTRDAQSFRCRLHFLDTDVADPVVVGNFRTEVLDQVLRERIRSETEGVRNLILALAFTNAPVDRDAEVQG